MTIITAEWQDPLVFQYISSTAANRPVYVYASNLIEYMAHEEGFIGTSASNILININLLKPAAVFHARTSEKASIDYCNKYRNGIVSVVCLPDKHIVIKKPHQMSHIELHEQLFSPRFTPCTREAVSHYYSKVSTSQKQTPKPSSSSAASSSTGDMSWMKKGFLLPKEERTQKEKKAAKKKAT